jgi:hypothetical protein
MLLFAALHESASWHFCDMPTASGDVRFQRVTRKTFAQIDSSEFDPYRTANNPVVKLRSLPAR